MKTHRMITILIALALLIGSTACVKQLPAPEQATQSSSGLESSPPAATGVMDTIFLIADSNRDGRTGNSRRFYLSNARSFTDCTNSAAADPADYRHLTNSRPIHNRSIRTCPNSGRPYELHDP